MKKINAFDTIPRCETELVIDGNMRKDLRLIERFGLRAFEEDPSEEEACADSFYGASGEHTHLRVPFSFFFLHNW